MGEGDTVVVGMLVKSSGFAGRCQGDNGEWGQVDAGCSMLESGSCRRRRAQGAIAQLAGLVSGERGAPWLLGAKSRSFRFSKSGQQSSVAEENASRAHRGGNCLDAACVLLICTVVVVADEMGEFNDYFWPLREAEGGVQRAEGQEAAGGGSGRLTLGLERLGRSHWADLEQGE
jgi:hypothetical protein